ncbi:mll0948 protein [Vibrio ishigakensis]|uniref:Mll0948 protein n=1 Tax=Vibrio ishigakensis TaxID=1481914 RepID=A0A0B8Q9Q2_9VIBR|nr:mll0948 protein [Vibrio ishigakensis]
MQQYTIHSKQRGLVIIFATLAMLVFLIIAGLVIDTGYAYYKYRQAQTAADAAALTGAYEIKNGRDTYNNVSTKALAAAAELGFTSGTDDTLVTIESSTVGGNQVVSPTTGAYVGDTSAVRATVSDAFPSFFLSVIGIEQIDYSVSATARGGVGVSNNCIYVLGEENKEKMLYVTSDSQLNANCGIVANSRSNKGLYVSSGSEINATTVETVGGSDISGSSVSCSVEGADCPTDKNSDNPPTKVADPLANIPAPAVNYSTCDYGSPGGSRREVENGTINPGTYCGGLLIKGHVKMNDGLYVMRGGGFVVDGSGSSAKNAGSGGVTIYNTCKNACTGSEDDEKDYWAIELKSGSGIELEATKCNGSCSGYEGILFFADRNAPESPEPEKEPRNYFDSSASSTFKGIIYLPQQSFEVTSGSSGFGAETIIVSKYLYLSSSSVLNISSLSSGENPITSEVTLVE